MLGAACLRLSHPVGLLVNSTDTPTSSASTVLRTWGTFPELDGITRAVSILARCPEATPRHDALRAATLDDDDARAGECRMATRRFASAFDLGDWHMVCDDGAQVRGEVTDEKNTLQVTNGAGTVALHTRFEGSATDRPACARRPTPC